MSVSVKIDDREVMESLNKLTESGTEIAVAALDGARLEMQNEAKRLAPWTDRTGNARNSITGSAPQVNGSVVSAILSIGVFYGVYLELKNKGKFRIVWPTIEWESTRMGLWINKAYAKVMQNA